MRKTNAIDVYFEEMEKNCLYKISEELLGVKYGIYNNNDVEGTISRITIGDGIEIAYWDSEFTMEWFFNSEKYKDDIIEIMYCYNGKVEVECFPKFKKYIIDKEKLSFYKMSNSIQHFNFFHKDFEAISIHIDLNSIKKLVNPKKEEVMVEDWKNLLEAIFSKESLIVGEASYEIKYLAEKIRKIPLENMLDYIKLKSKVMEFITLCLEYKVNEQEGIANIGEDEINNISMARNILLNDLKNPPTVAELARELNMTIYKLQNGFKKITGNTVYEYIRRNRIEKAKTLLHTTDISIINIAGSVGYENPSKFSTTFKKYTDMTPTEYRKCKKANL